MKFQKSTLLVSFILLSLLAGAQEVYHFKKALFLSSGGRYGREAIYTDALAYQLYTNTLKTPADSAVWGKDDTGAELRWQSVVADTANRLFRRGGRGGGGFGRGGYMYLTYESDKEKVALLNVRGSSGLYFNGESHGGDPYSSGWLYIPVKIKKGLNEIYLRSTFAIANLTFPVKPVSLNTEDPTFPHIVVGAQSNALQAAVVVINSSPKELKGLQIRSIVAGREVMTSLPNITPMSTRKTAFDLDGSSVTTSGKQDCKITLMANGKVIDEAVVAMDGVSSTDKHSNTFISQIDGSLQYYAVTPQTGTNTSNSALFLSVHGAGVEAIGQARAYIPKDWGNLVAATNRRPRGFNWEDWGRLDALEVLQIAKDKFKPDAQKVYLTGHSMGGHGTWFLGATYPDKWAAIAPCAGYPTLKGYGSADGLIPDSSGNALEQMLLRSGNQSDVIKLVSNYKPLGVYVFHGDADRTVSVNYARQMRGLLGGFHSDLSYYEYPGGSHWFGDHSVDWKPIFEFFKWHQRPLDSAVNVIDFMTASPGISSSYYWACVLQQQHPLQYSRIKLNRNKATKTIDGTTENVRLLQFGLKEFATGTQIRIVLDGGPALQYTTRGAGDTLFLLKEANSWTIGSKPDFYQKGPHRYGTLKDAFNHRMIFVYGTSGTKEENEWSFNKARYDAETWYYRGNGAVDIIADKDFTIDKYRDRGVIIFGNKTSNRAWNALLADCPIQVERNKITAGDKTWQGDDLSAYFVWPIKSSSIASVGVISGSGLKGMNAANANQYFAGASGFPDFMIYSLEMLRSGPGQVKMAGFFDYNWQLVPGEMELSKEGL
ncbi:MAG: prolyl oligopeptidase family serine peptidase [Gemmatimonadaceae bacterium]|nr:prolyl oligopeptidase family serine peptidase [Chitinophagaceae bacterium]